MLNSWLHFLVAIAYLMHKTPYVFPIIGGRKVEHLLANVEALEISLSTEQIKYLESVVPFNPGFPNSMIVSTVCSEAGCMMAYCAGQGDGSTTSRFVRFTGNVDDKPSLRPVLHGQDGQGNIKQ